MGEREFDFANYHRLQIMKRFNLCSSFSLPPGQSKGLGEAVIIRELGI